MAEQTIWRRQVFKSIQWKILTVFVLLIVSVMIAVGTFLLNSVSSYYHKEFVNHMEQMVFTNDFKKQLSDAANGTNPVEDIKKLFDIYSGRIGLDSYRSYSILSAHTASVIYSSDGRTTGDIDVSQNLLSAMEGSVGDTVNRRARFMDFAYPIERSGGAGYIVYIADSKEELYGILGNIFKIIFWALFLGLIISAIIGLFMSRTIIAPIISLKNRAEKIADGDFEERLEIKSRDEIGDLTKTFNIMATELAATLSEIAKEKTKVETILRFMTDAVIAFYRGGTVMHINPAAEEILSGAVSDGITFNSFFKSLGVEVEIKDLLYLEHFKTLVRDMEYEGKVLKAHFAPFATSDGTADGVVVVIQDITEQQKLDVARKEFVANVSHELRTPLTTIKSYTETLRENAEENSMEANFLAVIESEADRMTRLVKDLLTLSLLDYDKKAMSKAMFSVNDLTKSIVQRLTVETSRRNQVLTFEGNDNMQPLYGDKDRIEQVITNIITNAIKYTHDGGIISVRCTGVLTDAVITVTDTGVGIPKADIPHLFDRFYRVDKARSRKRGGTGLGLAIAKEITDAHGGEITIESQQGKGTKVTLKIPFYSK